MNPHAPIVNDVPPPAVNARNADTYNTRKTQKNTDKNPLTIFFIIIQNVT